MSTMTIWRGFAITVDWTIDSVAGTPLDLDSAVYSAVACDFDDAKGAVDKLSVTGAILQTGSGAEAVNKGRVRIALVTADTEAWEGDVKIRHQWRLQRVSDGEWVACGGPDPVIVRDRVADSLA